MSTLTLPFEVTTLEAEYHYLPAEEPSGMYPGAQEEFCLESLTFTNGSDAMAYFSDSTIIYFTNMAREMLMAQLGESRVERALNRRDAA